MGEARTYDAWGQVRSQVGSDGKLRYCANLGHKQDDESGLIYMRARYYEPTSGRFVSEDRSRVGINWFIYANNSPISMVDQTGCHPDDQVGFGTMMIGIGATFGFLFKCMSVCAESMVVGLAGLLFLAAWFGAKLLSQLTNNPIKKAEGWERYGQGVAMMTMLQLLLRAEGSAASSIAAMAKGATPVSPKTKAKAVCAAYATSLFLFMEMESTFGGLFE